MAPMDSPAGLGNTEGSVITLRSLSGFAEGQDFYLDGRTLEHAVGLAPTAEAPYTGTSWYAVPTDSAGEYALNCLGPARSPGEENTNAWLALDATGAPILAAAPDSASPWRWRLDDDPAVDAVQAVTVRNAGQGLYLLGDTPDVRVTTRDTVEGLMHQTTWQVGPAASGVGWPPPPNDDQ